MTRYFQLRDDVTIGGRWHLSDVRSSEAEPVLDEGVPLINPGRLVATVSHAGRVLEFTVTSFNVPVATSWLAKAVGDTAGSDVQCIPVEIAGKSGFRALNATRVIRCLDEERSEFIKWTQQDHRPDLAGQYRQVTKLVLAPAMIPADAHYFRIAGWLVALVVSEAVKNAMQAAGCLGARFVELPS
jgi:hypothetical protein